MNNGYTQYQNLKFEVLEKGIAVLKISRPEALNALNGQTLIELESALTQISKDTSVRVLIFTGDGDRSFIAGADIVEMKDKTIEEGIAFAELGQRVSLLLETMPKPVIAVVQGYALGGGTEMALACDFILASDRALFGQPEVCLGIIPGFGGTARLVRHVGLPMAKEMLYTGRKIKADEALSLRLVNHVYAPDVLMSKAMEFAKSICENSHAAVVQCKTLMNTLGESSETLSIKQKLKLEATTFGKIFGTHDQREGMGAFGEKRKANYQ